MCLSPDEMTSSELEKLILHYQEMRNYSNNQAFLDERIEKIEALLKERANNGTYDVVPTATPRHVR